VFLIQRARLHGYSIYLDVNPKTKKERLSFRRSESIRDVTYELAWGASLSEFRPTLTTAQQVAKVKVMGWDRKAGKPITGEAEWGKDCKLNRDQTSISQAVEGREEVITDIPVFSKKDADQKARGILCGKLYQMVKASGSTVGLPQLRAGSRVHIKKLGPRFSGEYFVTETTHTIGDGGYKTSFNARREKALEGGA
jgi:phage protein D